MWPSDSRKNTLPIPLLGKIIPLPGGGRKSQVQLTNNLLSSVAQRDADEYARKVRAKAERKAQKNIEKYTNAPAFVEVRELSRAEKKALKQEGKRKKWQ